MSDQRWFQIMTNLLYPAVLGTLIYTFADSTLKPGVCVDDPLFWGGLALFPLFMFDYAHSLREDVRASYDASKFLADLVIVSCLFLAGKAILKAPVFSQVDYVWWLFGAKAAAVIWEQRESKSGPAGRKSQPAQAASRLVVFGIETDLALCVAYLVLGILAAVGASWWLWVAPLAMALDAHQYYRYSRQ